MEKNESLLIKKSALILSLIAGFLFAFFVRTEADLFAEGNIVWNGKYLATLLLACIGGAALFGGGYYFVKRFVASYSRVSFDKEKPWSSRTLFFVSLGVNLLAYIPFFLAYYPGIMAYDFPIQLEQIINNAYNNHHPLIHTLLQKGCLLIGEGIFKSAIVGVAISTLIQLVFLAVALAFAMFTINELGARKWSEVALQILFCFQLINGFLAVSITKDVIFTGFVIIFISSLTMRIKKKKAKMNVLVFIGALGVCLFRNNGLYAVLLMALVGVIIVVASKGSQKKAIYGRMIICVFAALVIGVMVNKGLSILTGAAEGDKREMLSVPIQQLARVAVYEGDKLTEDEKALIDEFLLYESYKNYNPVISDPVKGNTNTSVVRYQSGRFAKVYLSLLKKYPGDFVNAFLSLIGGYVSPFDETYRVMWVDGNLVTRNYIQHTFTAWGQEDYVYEKSLLPKLKVWLDDYAENDRFNFPVLKLFIIPGIYLWIYLGLFISMVDRCNYKMVLPWIFVMAYFGTLFLGPTMNLRYIYPLMVSLPIVFVGSIDHET